MELFDSHCHIHEAVADLGFASESHKKWLAAGRTNPDAIIKDAAAAGVTKMVCIGTTLNDSRQAIKFVADRPGLWASIGIHPHEAANHLTNENWADFAALATSPKVVAVGEIGLDYFYDHSPREQQIELLHKQLRLASDHNLPVSFHVRQAFKDFWPIFDQYPGLHGVLHSFTDNQVNLAEALKRGLHIGVNGIVTFAKDPAQLAVYKAIPLDRLLVETDAPYLTPTPYRGTICEPKHVRVTAEFLAQLRGEDFVELAATTSQNAIHLFGCDI